MNLDGEFWGTLVTGAFAGILAVIAAAVKFIVDSRRTAHSSRRAHERIDEIKEKQEKTESVLQDMRVQMHKDFVSREDFDGAMTRLTTRMDKILERLPVGEK